MTAIEPLKKIGKILAYSDSRLVIAYNSPYIDPLHIAQFYAPHKTDELQNSHFY